MAIPTQYQVISPSTQTIIGGGHLHTPPSIFQHMMGQHNPEHQPGSWDQVPQVPPMYMPWSVPSLQQSRLVTFTGEQQQQTCGPMVHQKRKLDITDVESSRKQFISEEKMAAHFRDMHISSHYTPTLGPSTSSACPPSQPSTSTTSEVEIDSTPVNLQDGKSMHPRLVISEELKRLQNEPLLPASLLSKLERPSMALVLWEPPTRHLRLPLHQHPPAQPSTSTAEEDDNNNNIDNNNEQIPDLNQAYSSTVQLEPMDL
ncbi:uncharacterized protein LOC135168227 isoform X2 [Diachasmimorpha longicaudata]|uniref:uncharacterized protein LOC135168227 isoform X2 n=1 Tax=Diachasmimorpha longicaudata TaxID=58733 RepID=UPI0030B8809C